MDINKNRLASGGNDEDYTKDSTEEISEERMMPQDVDAFFKHPLVAANQEDNGDAIALLHEYQTLYSGQSNRTDNSPIQLFDASFNQKLTTASGLNLPMTSTFAQEMSGTNKELNFYKEGFNSRSLSNTMIEDSFPCKPSHQHKSSIRDPTLPSINVLSRSTFPQNLFTSSTPADSINSHNVLIANQSGGWKSTMNPAVGQLKPNDGTFKLDADGGGGSYRKTQLENSFMVARDEANNLKLNKLPALSLLNEDATSLTQSNQSRASFPSTSSQFSNQPGLMQQTTFAGITESSAIDMSFQGQNLKMANNSERKFLTSKQFFGDSDLIQMLEKQIPPEQFSNSINLSNAVNSKISQKLHPGIPSLPFPLPEVPLGYRLVITHLPITNDQEPDSKHITQLIIDNPIVQQTPTSLSSPLIQRSDFQQKSQQNIIQAALKTREIETELNSAPYNVHKFTTMDENRVTNTNADSTTIPKENILEKSLEEANLLPLLTQEPPRSQVRDISPDPSLDISLLEKELNGSTWQTPVHSSDVSSSTINITPEVSRSPTTKRHSYKGKTSARWNHVSFIPKIEPDNSGFKFCLEAAISTNPKKDEDRVTYLNKSQYYGLVLQHNPPTPEFFCVSPTLKSVVMLVFRERLSVLEEMKAWECWYSRQHSYKQRVLDIDSKNSGESEGFSKAIFIEEIAHNAASISWNKHTCVKLNLALNCLSTDFSHQKGIRGNPLHIQIDTYDGDQASQPTHRAYCQIKVFCDKGADRKVREEERKRSKNSEDNEHQVPCDQSYFYSMADLTTPPVLFSPSISSQLQALDTKMPSMNLSSKRQSSDNMEGLPESKKQAIDKLLLFVREERDTVFNALVVQPTTVESLSRAIQEKFLSNSVNIENIFKESKFMKVKVDDVIMSCISDESTFNIRFENHPQSLSSNENLNSCDVTLTEIRVQTN